MSLNARNFLKRVQLREGKFYLEDQLVEPEILKLANINLIDRYRRLIPQTIRKHAPTGANAYCIGKPEFVRYSDEGLNSQDPPSINGHDIYPVIYLRIQPSQSTFPQ